MCLIVYLFIYLFLCSRGNGEEVNFWVGANFIQTNTVLRWSSGTLPYKNWQHGQPEGENTGYCLELRKEYAYKWNAGNCKDKQKFVCEIDLF